MNYDFNLIKPHFATGLSGPRGSDIQVYWSKYSDIISTLFSLSNTLTDMSRSFEIANENFWNYQRQKQDASFENNTDEIKRNRDFFESVVRALAFYQRIKFYDLRICVETLHQHNISGCQFNTSIESDDILHALNLFDEYFPDAKKERDTAAHETEVLLGINKEQRYDRNKRTVSGFNDEESGIFSSGESRIIITGAITPKGSFSTSKTSGATRTNMDQSVGDKLFEVMTLISEACKSEKICIC